MLAALQYTLWYIELQSERSESGMVFTDASTTLIRARDVTDKFRYSELLEGRQHLLFQGSEGRIMDRAFPRLTLETGVTIPRPDHVRYRTYHIQKQ